MKRFKGVLNVVMGIFFTRTEVAKVSATKRNILLKDPSANYATLTVSLAKIPQRIAPVVFLRSTLG
jgi:hypothetical protein